MKSDARTPEEYILSLPEDRRGAIAKVREVILRNLPAGYEEAMGFGMICYQVPLSVYPNTYNKQPLLYVALANQKNHMAIYLMSVYGHAPLEVKLRQAYEAAGKKLDLGKSCLRFKSLEDLLLDTVGEIVAAVPMDKYVAFVKKAYRVR